MEGSSSREKIWQKPFSNEIPSTDGVKTEDHYYSNDFTALYIVSMSAIP